MRSLAVVLFRAGGFMIMLAALGGAARFIHHRISETAGVATDAAQWAWFLQTPMIIVVAMIGILFAGSGIALGRLAPASRPSNRAGSIRDNRRRR